MTYSLTKGEMLSLSYWKLYEASKRKNEGIFYTQRISRRYFGPEARRWIGRRGREAPPIFLEPAEGKRSHERRAWRSERSWWMWRRVVRCSRGRKWRGVLMRFRYRPGHLVSRLYLPTPTSDVPRTISPYDVDEHVRMGGGEGGSWK